MEYKSSIIPIQTRADGSVLSVHSYTFSSGDPGPKIYLQANLHGPEVFGTALLLKLMKEFSSWEKIPGTLTLVPCANPVGVQEAGYETQLGRWNPQSGTDWNRIFEVPSGTVWYDEKAEREFYENLLKYGDPSVENRLVAGLRLSSAGSKYVIDIHTTGVETKEHVFTVESSSKSFEPLLADFHFLKEGRNAGKTFEESHRYPFRKWEGEKERFVCTWKLARHGKMEEYEVEDRFRKLLNWLHFIWGFGSRLPEKKPITLNECGHLFAPEGGYYVWTKPIGSFIKKGESYAEIYHPETADITIATAPYDLHLVAKYGVGATGNGEQIGWVGY